MSNKNNKWERLTAPNPPLFFGKKEREFVKSTTDQLVECVIGQQILYFPIDIERTNYHKLYGEAIEKVFLSPVHAYVLVEFGGQSTENTNYGIDKKSSPIKVHFHKKRISEDQDLWVREGDFLQYGDNFYEIVDLNELKEMFGQNDFKVEITAICIKAREENFNGSY